MNFSDSKALAVIPPPVIDDEVLAKINYARQLLSAAKTIQDAKHIADVATAAKVYAQRVGASVEIVNRAGEIRIEAEHLLGQMLKQTKKNTGAAGVGPIAVPEGNRNQEPTLKEQGISKKLSARAQKLADIPIADVHEAIEEQKAEGVEITTTGTLKRIDPETKTITAPVESPRRKRKRRPNPYVRKPGGGWMLRSEATKSKLEPKAEGEIIDIDSAGLGRMKELWTTLSDRDRSEFVKWLKQHIEPSDGIIITGDTIKLGAGMEQLATFIWHNFQKYHDKQWDGVIKKAKAGQESLSIKGENKA